MTVEERQTKRAKKAMIMEDFVADMIVFVERYAIVEEEEGGRRGRRGTVGEACGSVWGTREGECQLKRKKEKEKGEKENSGTENKRNVRNQHSRGVARWRGEERQTYSNNYWQG